MVETNDAAVLPDLFRTLAPNYKEPDAFDAPSLHWGVIGPGGIAGRFASDLSQYSTQSVEAVGSRDVSRATQFTAEHNIDQSRAYGTYEELVADPNIDAVYVATPHNFHKENALLALRAGKHVLVEKPFAMSAAEAREVFDEADQRGLFAMEAMWSRHLPHYTWIREVVKAGTLGPLRHFAADHGQMLLHVPRLVEPSLAGGAMLDLGVYPMHLQQMVLGKPDRIESISRMSAKDVDLSDMVISEYGQASAVSSCEMDARTPMAALLSFEKGNIRMPEQFLSPTTVVLDVHELDPVDSRVLGSKSATWDARIPGGFQYQAAEAARCINAGKLQSEVVPWDATVEVQEMMDQVLTSAGYFGSR